MTSAVDLEKPVDELFPRRMRRRGNRQLGRVEAAGPQVHIARADKLHDGARVSVESTRRTASDGKEKRTDLAALEHLPQDDGDDENGDTDVGCDL